MYRSIAPHYDSIFPPDRSAVDFLRKARADSLAALAESRIPPPGTAGERADTCRFIDLGCGTGSLALALAERAAADHATGNGEVWEVTGIDLDEEMVDIARAKASAAKLHDAATFSLMGVSDTSDFFAPGSFDLALCSGNVICHLDGLPETGRFLDSTASILSPGSPLVIQLVNYDYVIREGLRGLRTIEADGLSFSREYLSPSGNLARGEFFTFRTTLVVAGSTDSGAPDAIGNETRLYPLTRDELEACLDSSGFDVIARHSDFGGAPLGRDSPALVLTARKR